MDENKGHYYKMWYENLTDNSGEVVMAKMKVVVEYLVDLKELEMSRDTYHGGSDLSLHNIFADDLQSHAHDGEGCLYGTFTVVSVSEVV